MYSNWSMEDVQVPENGIAVITGANSGIGYETAKVLAAKGVIVVMACRNLEKASQARSSIIDLFPYARIDIMEFDTSRFDLIRDFAEQFSTRYGRLDILVNNAGVMMAPKPRPDLPYEMQFGVNHLGHFLLTGLMLPLLQVTPDSRVISVYSLAYIYGLLSIRRLLRQGVLRKPRVYSSLGAYSRSKLANLLFTKELHRRLQLSALPIRTGTIPSKNPNPKSIAVHPGVTVTKLTGHFGTRLYDWLVSPILRRIGQSPEQGALSILRAALDPDAKSGDCVGPSGPLGIRGNPKIYTPRLPAGSVRWGKRLWEISQKMGGIAYL